MPTKKPAKQLPAQTRKVIGSAELGQLLTELQEELDGDDLLLDHCAARHFDVSNDTYMRLYLKKNTILKPSPLDVHLPALRKALGVADDCGEFEHVLVHFSW